MKTLYSIIFLFLISSSSFSQTNITISAGLATPNDKINDVYNSDRLGGDSSTFDLLRNSASLGYNLSARIRFSLGDNLLFDGGIGFARFPQSDIKVKNPASGAEFTLQTTQNVIPISAGVDYVFFKKLLCPYVSGELQYNYISSSVDYSVAGIGVPLDKSPADNRVGAALGAGTMIDLGLIALNVDVRYHMMNLIGKTADEKSKAFLTANLGVAIGWR